MNNEQLNNNIKLVCNVCLKNIGACNTTQKEICYCNFRLMYKLGYNDAFDKYVPKENEIQMFRRSGHP